MPVIVNEPISLLQRVLSQANPVRQMAEDLEYCSLLSQAALASDPLDRLLLVAAFAVSSYASSQTRATRKPFNPLLGETYELTRPDLGFRFVAEKVSHHPTIIAGHANGDRFTYAQENCVKSKFWGKSVELRPHGLVHVVLKTTGEHFVWSKVTTRISGMLERTISHVGDMTVRCIHPCPSTETGAAPEYPSISATAPGNVLKDGSSAAGLSVTLSFKDSGYFSASPCTRVTTTDISFTPDASTSSENDPGNGSKRPNSAVLYSSSSSKPHSPIVKTLEGTWTHELAIGENVVWRYNKPLLDEDSAFGFGAFAVSLNELCYDILPLLPRTDSRYVSQVFMVRAFADEEKMRLEQKQRDAIKKSNQQQQQQHGKDHGGHMRPRWFIRKPVVDPQLKGQTVAGKLHGRDTEWTFTNEYWHAKKKGFEKVPGIRDLFS